MELFFKKTSDEKEITLVSLSWLMFGVLLFLASFWLVFLSTRTGEGKRVLYSLGVTTYLFRRKTRAFAKKKKEERRAKEL